jgi:hypothetical protein
MTLILNNDQIADLVSMQDCVDVLEDALSSWRKVAAPIGAAVTSARHSASARSGSIRTS